MTTLVTGATGFLGGHLVRLLAERGDRIRAFVLPGTARDPLRQLSAEIAEGDMRDDGAVRAAAAGCELRSEEHTSELQSR